ncbi:MAG: hypothetical protein SWQ30_13950 [Thermodesulfobacteriota bacterium]|nr:hypothetical protein [Thermodesulfobacteriota bacterium]
MKSLLRPYFPQREVGVCFFEAGRRLDQKRLEVMEEWGAPGTLPEALKSEVERGLCFFDSRDVL